MPTASGNPRASEKVPGQQRAYDGRGNVRPADDRFLTEAQAQADADFVVENGEPLAVAEEVTIDDVARRAGAIAKGLDPMRPSAQDDQSSGLMPSAPAGGRPDPAA